MRAAAMVALVLVAGCAVSSRQPPRATLDAEREAVEEILLGELRREEIEAALPVWVAAQVDSEVDTSAAAELSDLGTGAEVTVYFGSWCSDSRRELARLWRAFDTFGVEPSFSIRYVAVDRSKKEPRDLVGDAEILYVPTFVVEDEGRETGRVVESAPNGIEKDLLSLLTGKVRGWVSGRDDLPLPKAPGS